MDRQLAERMVGAAVLLVALVVIVPAVLDGRGDLAADGPGPADAPIDLRTHTIQLDGDARRPPVPRAADPLVPASSPLVVEPEAGPEASATADSARAAGTDAGNPGVPDPPPPPDAVEPAPAASPRPAGAPGPASRPFDPVAAAPASVPPSPAAGAAAAAGEWLVQLGSFARRDNADRLAGAVRDRGFAADVSETRGGSGRLFRVRVGPATTREAADARARELAAAGYRGSVTRR
jgi:DedD protein